MIPPLCLHGKQNLFGLIPGCSLAASAALHLNAKCRRAELRGAGMHADVFAWFLNIVIVVLAAALLLSIGGW
jgi:hypothetical protein